MVILQVSISPLESSLICQVWITTTDMQHYRTSVKSTHHLLTWFQDLILKLKIITNDIFNLFKILFCLIATKQVYIVRTVIIQVVIKMIMCLLNTLLGIQESNVLFFDSIQLEAFMNTIVINTIVWRREYKIKSSICCDATERSILEQLVS